jgi:N-acetylneuraminic acid mutarotase
MAIYQKLTPLTFPGDTETLKVKEIAVDILGAPGTSAVAGKQGDIDGAGMDQRSPQNNSLLAPAKGGGTWTRKADMPTARSYFASAEVNGQIYAIGGLKDNLQVCTSTVEEYDPASDKWIKKTDMPAARSALSASVVNGKIYAVGGTEDWNLFLPTVEEYDPVSDKWTKKTDMPTARISLSTCAINGRIYAIGGRVRLPDMRTQAIPVVEEYDPVSDKWTGKSDMLTARQLLSVSVVNGKIYAIGGLSNDASVLPTVEEYDPATDKWTVKSDMPTARQGLSTAVLYKKIYAIGGSVYEPKWGWYRPIPTVEEYDVATDTWTGKASISVARNHPSANAVNGNIYAIGGQDTNNLERSTVEEYDPGSEGKGINIKGKLPTTWGGVRTALNK